MYTKLTGLKPEDYEYPGERSALWALRKIPLLDKLVAEKIKLTVQTQVLPEMAGGCFCVSEKTCPTLYKLYLTACERLNMSPDVPFYVKAEFDYNAGMYGGAKPLLMVHSSIINNYKEDELLFIIGHELGHLNSGHAIYNTIGANLAQLIQQIPAVGPVADMGIYYAFMAWYRMSEYTADRAGALAAGGTDAAIRGLAKFMGVDDRVGSCSFTTEALLKQNDSFELGNSNLLAKAATIYALSESTHPFTISRIKALNQWETSGEFDALIERFTHS